MGELVPHLVVLGFLTLVSFWVATVVWQCERRRRKQYDAHKQMLQEENDALRERFRKERPDAEDTDAV